MRKITHICLTSHNEVMFRCEEDFNYAFNCLAVAVLENDCRLLAEAELTTHLHLCFSSDCVHSVVRQFRYSYSRYFNAKYHRNGRAWDKNCFVTELDGALRIMAATSYIMRQGLHHGITTTAFGYPFCSVNTLFRNELGKGDNGLDIIHRGLQYKYLPSSHSLHSNIRMHSNGLIFREDIIDTAYMEELYITPRNFLFQMTRLTNEKWADEQKEKDGRPPVTLNEIERSELHSDSEITLAAMCRNEKGLVNLSVYRDLDLCSIIDNKLVPQYFTCQSSAGTIYDVPENIRCEWAERLYSQNVYGRGQGARVSEKQIRRCLIL